MSSDRGYIKLYRDIREHWLWEDKPFSRGQAWIDILMMANHEGKEILFNGRILTVERGSCITSIRKLSQQWGWSIHKVSDFLDELERDGMLTQKRDTKKTVLKACNYGIYQASEKAKRNTEGTLKEHSGNTEGTLKETNNTLIRHYKDTKKKKTPLPPTQKPTPEPQKTNEELEQEGWYLPS